MITNEMILECYVSLGGCKHPKDIETTITIGQVSICGGCVAMFSSLCALRIAYRESHFTFD